MRLALPFIEPCPALPPLPPLQAERNRHMGQRRRQAREELQRRERDAANEGSTAGLGAGGEARIAAAKLDELRQRGDVLRQQQSDQRSAAWDSARASAKKRRASWGASASGAVNDEEELEERTVRVKWSNKKQSHSDHTLDMLFSRFGRVESVMIEAGKGDRALVSFAEASSADAAVAAYRNGETMRASFVGKRRPKRGSVFAQRRQTMSPAPQRSDTGGVEGSGAAGISQSSFRDRESLVMMKLRQEAERQALIRKMADQEANNSALKTPGMSEAGSTRAVHTPRGVTRESISAVKTPAAAGTEARDGQAGVSERAETSSKKISGGNRDGGDVEDGESGVTLESIIGERTSQPNASPSDGGGGVRRTDSIFPVPSPALARGNGHFSTRRESDILSAMMSRSTPERNGVHPSAVGMGGSKSVPVTPVSGRDGSSIASRPIDEGDVLARMLSMKP